MNAQSRWMLFVDGENLTIRAQDFAETAGIKLSEPTRYLKDTFVWFPGYRALELHGLISGFPSQQTAIRGLSFAKTSAAGQVVDLSALILTHSQLDDHSRAPPASAAPVPLGRPPPARDRELRPASATRRIQEDGAPAPTSHDGPPLLGRTGQSLDRHLRRTLTRYFAYYPEARTHLSLDKDAPDGRSVERPERGRVISIREVGGLHHRYVRRAA